MVKNTLSIFSTAFYVVKITLMISVTVIIVKNTLSILFQQLSR